LARAQVFDETFSNYISRSAFVRNHIPHDLGKSGILATVELLSVFSAWLKFIFENLNQIRRGQDSVGLAEQRSQRWHK
jgi:hypothetical protein